MIIEEILKLSIFLTGIEYASWNKADDFYVYTLSQSQVFFMLD